MSRIGKAPIAVPSGVTITITPVNDPPVAGAPSFATRDDQALVVLARIDGLQSLRATGRGPHPIVIMVHGGCWQTDIAVPCAGPQNRLL